MSLPKSKRRMSAMWRLRHANIEGHVSGVTRAWQIRTAWRGLESARLAPNPVRSVRLTKCVLCSRCEPFRTCLSRHAHERAGLWEPSRSSGFPLMRALRRSPLRVEGCPPNQVEILKDASGDTSATFEDMSPSDSENRSRLFSIAPATKAETGRISQRAHCGCLAFRDKADQPNVLDLHIEPQDHSVPGWTRTIELIHASAQAQSTVFHPSADIKWDDWLRVITLPPDLGDLRGVRQIRLYGSHLRRVPPEIGRMEALEDLDIYTSYSLHWLPYEITRCFFFRQSRMSTRALYGNRKTRLPFPRLSRPIETLLPPTCSVCDRPFDGSTPRLFWITLRIGTDDAPLLVHSCSKECTLSLPAPPLGYHPRPHQGGAGIGMPQM